MHRADTGIAGITSQALFDALNKAMDESRPFLGKGSLPHYIPALTTVDARQFGMSVTTVGGLTLTVGEGERAFSAQSITKLISLMLALRWEGDRLWRRVGYEASGMPYNSLIQLEFERGIPRNPFINAGALVTLDRVMQHQPNPCQFILRFVRELSGNPAIAYDDAVFESERRHAHANLAAAHLLKSFGTLDSDVDTLLDQYCRLCSLAMSCRDLTLSFASLANGGTCPRAGERLLPVHHVRRVIALMRTCGMYDASGEFAYRVGLPGKSGVGGGIVALAPQQLCIAAWSPTLDSTGNSVAGVRALESFSSTLNLT